MYLFADLAELLTSLLLLVSLLVLIRSGRRRWFWIATVLIAVKVVAAVVLIGYGPVFAVRPLRDLALLLVPYVWTAWRPGKLSARLLAVAGGAAVVLDLSISPLWIVLGIFVLVALTVAMTTRRWVAPLVLVVALASGAGAGMAGSQAPAALNMGPSNMAGMAGMRSVTSLTGGPTTGPVKKYTIVASQVGSQLTFGGTVPGTPIRVTQGDVLEVTLVNHLPDLATTIHWHGIDVPNAEDGVAGVTQDAVKPGGQFTYRFQVNQVGTFWYHSHEQTKDEVTRGLFGLLVVEPKTGKAEVDEALMIHDGAGVPNRRVRPGAGVRMRVVNAESQTHQVQVTGTPWRLAAVDGSDLNEPGELGSQLVPIGGGGRADVTFTMPDHPVRISLPGVPDIGYVLSPDGKSTVDADAPGPEVDLMTYGKQAPVDIGDRFTRDYTVDLDQGIGFRNGAPAFAWTMNGQVFPDAPMLMVTEGDLVKVTFRNESLGEHPMHLHGHRVLVLSRDGTPSTGSPLWMDTVLVRPGETVVVAFKADNPGIWMDHCHDLGHAAIGMVMHLAYEDVTTPFSVGTGSGNEPE